MALRTLTYTINGDPADFFRTVKSAATDAGAKLTGDASTGSFSHKGVEGTYRVIGTTVTVDVNKKPRMATWGMIEGPLESFFG